MKKLLTFKHWQLFILIFICGAWTSPSPLKEIINSVSILTFTFWIYAIGVNGQEKIAELGLKPMNVKLFKVNVIIVCVFLFLSLIFFSQMEASSSDTFGLKDIPLMIGGLYLFFAIFQTMFFACKTIAKIEYQREVLLGDYFANLVQMLFIFVGIWILQPKISRLIPIK